MSNIVKKAVYDSLVAVAYIALVALFMTYAGDIFGGDDSKTVLIPIMMMTLLVLSAAITGSLVFGRSVMWYLDNKKREALVLLGYKLVTLFVFFIIFAVIIFITNTF